MNPDHNIEIGAAYVRVSTDEQTELSPDAQIRVIHDAAKADGYIIPEEYIFIEKRGISGRKADNRPEFQRMIAIAKSQAPAPFTRLYVWKFSRFARNQEESVFYKSILRKKCGVDIKSVSEPVMEGMFGRLIESIIEWFDEYYSINLSGEVLRGMTEKALRNGYQATPCLGYRAVGGGQPHVIDDHEYQIVEFIFSQYHDGMDMTRIARECNRRGYRTKRGNPFERRGIERMLKNKFYIGTVEWNGIVFDGTHETRASVTSLFQENLERLNQEYRPAYRRESSSCKHWLSGLLVCGVCGASLVFQPCKTQKRSSCFQCWKYAKGYHATSCSISVKKAERLLLESILQVLETGNVEFEYIRKPNQKNQDEISVLEAALARTDIKELRIKDAYENGIDSLDEYRANKLRLQEERDNISSQLRGITEQITAVPAAEQKADFMKNIQHTYDIISNPDIGYEIKGAALRRVIKKIVYNIQLHRLEIHYYI